MPVDDNFLSTERQYQSNSRITIKLKGHKQQAIHLNGTLHQPLDQESFTAVEIHQISHERQNSIGSLGIVIINGGKETK
jgi:hypothetical protein